MVKRDANNTEKDIPQKSLIEAFIENVKNNPDATAIFYDGEKKLTYRETAERAKQIAYALRTAGVKTGDKVAISLKNGKDMICSVLGVLWCGGAYVPVNPAQPVERRIKIYEQADIKYCVTYSGSLASEAESCRNIFADGIGEDAEKLENPYIAAPQETAYIIFTSGSTGVPKGVEIAHGSAWNTIADVLERFEITEKDTAMGVSALDFDLSVFDIFGMLSAGGSLVVLNDEVKREPAEWLKLMEYAKVSVWNSVPALLEMLLVSLKSDEILENLKTVLISGDKIRPALYSLFKEHTDNGRFIALGGATEASIWSNFYEVTFISDEWDMIPYGKPLSNQKFRVVTENGDAEDNVTGELWIGGKGLAKGYVSAPELTEKAFVTDEGERWYKTGDTGYYIPDGNIIFVGRIDNQVKINGFRIELGEIESRLAEVGNANQAVAIVKSDDAKKTLVGAIETVDALDYCEIEEVEAIVADPQDDNDCAVANFIQKVIYRNGKEFFNKSDLSAENAKIVSLWEKFLDGRTEPFETKNNTVEKLLDGKVEKMRDILSGELSPVALLDDEMLAPAKLMITPAIKEIARGFSGSIREQATGKDRFTIALLFGRYGDVYRELLEQLKDIADRITVVYFESSNAILKGAEQNYKEYGFEFKYVKTDYNCLSAEFAGIADAVVAINGMHLFRNLTYGLSWVKLLVANGGRIYMAEPEKLASIGLISAGVIESGFIEYENSRQNGSMVSRESWVKEYNNIGFDKIETDKTDEGICTYIAYSSKGKAFMNEEKLSEYCSGKLVSYMIPEKFIYAVKFPLTANGKIARNVISEWFSVEKSRNGTLPQTETEKQIAEIWSEIFSGSQVFVEDNFFEIGGDSLLATRMLNSLRNCFGVSISMREIFDNAVLKEIASMIDEKIGDSDIEEGEL